MNGASVHLDSQPRIVKRKTEREKGKHEIKESRTIPFLNPPLLMGEICPAERQA